MKKEITIYGVTYPSVAEAARQLNIPLSALYAKVKKGLRDEALLANNQSKSVTINGVTYPSIKAAAEATGINYQTLISRIKKGNADNSAPETTNGCKPITIAGTFYPSQTAAAKAHGISDGQLSELIKRANNEKRELDKIVHRAHPVTVQGETYPSIAAACKAYYVRPASALGRVKRYGESIAEAILYLSSHGHVNKVVVDGVTYPSIKAAREAYGVSKYRLNRRVNRYGESVVDAIQYLHSLDQVEKMSSNTSPKLRNRGG